MVFEKLFLFILIFNSLIFASRHIEINYDGKLINLRCESDYSSCKIRTNIFYTDDIIGFFNNKNHLIAIGKVIDSLEKDKLIKIEKIFTNIDSAKNIKIIPSENLAQDLNNYYYLAKKHHNWLLNINSSINKYLEGSGYTGLNTGILVSYMPDMYDLFFNTGMIYIFSNSKVSNAPTNRTDADLDLDAFSIYVGIGRYLYDIKNFSISLALDLGLSWIDAKIDLHKTDIDNNSFNLNIKNRFNGFAKINLNTDINIQKVKLGLFFDIGILHYAYFLATGLSIGVKI